METETKENTCSTSAGPSADRAKDTGTAVNLMAQGKRNIICGEIPAAVNQFQDACQLLSKHYGEMAKECAEAYFCYGQALLDLARMETGVLGNALQGVDVEEETADEEKEETENQQFENVNKLLGEEREKLRDEVYDAMADEKRKAEEVGSEKKDVKEGDVGKDEQKKTDKEDKTADKNDAAEKEKDGKTANNDDASEKDSKTADKVDAEEKDGKTAEKDTAVEKDKTADKVEDEKKEAPVNKDGDKTESKDKTKDELSSMDVDENEDSAPKEKPKEESVEGDAKKKEEKTATTEEVKKTDVKSESDDAVTKKDDKDESKTEKDEPKTVDTDKTKDAKPEKKTDESADVEMSEKDEETGESSKTKEDEKKEGEKTDGEKTEEDEEGDDDDEEEGDEEAEEGEEDGEDAAKTEEDPEDVSNLQLAWEMLELAKMIYLKDEVKEAQLRAAQSHLKLGEVSLETEQYEQAIADFKDCLRIQEAHLEPEDRLLAESHYQLGLAFGFMKQFDESVDHYRAAIKTIESKIVKLEELIAKGPVESKEPVGFEDPIKQAEQEIKDLNEILPDIRSKIEDTEEDRKSIDQLKDLTKEALGNLGNQMGEVTEFGNKTEPTNAPEKKASDISHLIRKKRKPSEDPETDADSKKSKQDIGGSGDAKAVTNGVEHKEKEKVEAPATEKKEEAMATS